MSTIDPNNLPSLSSRIKCRILDDHHFFVDFDNNVVSFADVFLPLEDETGIASRKRLENNALYVHRNTASTPDALKESLNSIIEHKLEATKQFREQVLSGKALIYKGSLQTTPLSPSKGAEVMDGTIAKIEQQRRDLDRNVTEICRQLDSYPPATERIKIDDETSLTHPLALMNILYQDIKEKDSELYKLINNPDLTIVTLPTPTDEFLPMTLRRSVPSDSKLNSRKILFYANLPHKMIEDFVEHAKFTDKLSNLRGEKPEDIAELRQKALEHASNARDLHKELFRIAMNSSLRIPDDPQSSLSYFFFPDNPLAKAAINELSQYMDSAKDMSPDSSAELLMDFYLNHRINRDINQFKQVLANSCGKKVSDVNLSAMERFFNEMDYLITEHISRTEGKSTSFGNISFADAGLPSLLSGDEEIKKIDILSNDVHQTALPPEPEWQKKLKSHGPRNIKFNDEKFIVAQNSSAKRTGEVVNKILLELNKHPRVSDDRKLTPKEFDFTFGVLAERTLKDTMADLVSTAPVDNVEDRFITSQKTKEIFESVPGINKPAVFDILGKPDEKDERAYIIAGDMPQCKYIPKRVIKLQENADQIHALLRASAAELTAKATKEFLPYFTLFTDKDLMNCVNGEVERNPDDNDAEHHYKTARLNAFLPLIKDKSLEYFTSDSSVNLHRYLSGERTIRNLNRPLITVEVKGSELGKQHLANYAVPISLRRFFYAALSNTIKFHMHDRGIATDDPVFTGLLNELKTAIDMDIEPDKYKRVEASYTPTVKLPVKAEPYKLPSSVIKNTSPGCVAFLEESKALIALLEANDVPASLGKRLMNSGISSLEKYIEAKDKIITEKERGAHIKKLENNLEPYNLPKARMLARSILGIDNTPDAEFTALPADTQNSIRTALLHSPILLAAISADTDALYEVLDKGSKLRKDIADAPLLAEDGYDADIEIYKPTAEILLGENPHHIKPQVDFSGASAIGKAPPAPKRERTFNIPEPSPSATDVSGFTLTATTALAGMQLASTPQLLPGTSVPNVESTSEKPADTTPVAEPVVKKSEPKADPAPAAPAAMSVAEILARRKELKSDALKTMATFIKGAEIGKKVNYLGCKISGDKLVIRLSANYVPEEKDHSLKECAIALSDELTPDDRKELRNTVTKMLLDTGLIPMRDRKANGETVRKLGYDDPLPPSAFDASTRDIALSTQGGRYSLLINASYVRQSGLKTPVQAVVPLHLDAKDLPAELPATITKESLASLAACADERAQELARRISVVMQTLDVPKDKAGKPAYSVFKGELSEALEADMAKQPHGSLAAKREHGKHVPLEFSEDGKTLTEVHQPDNEDEDDTQKKRPHRTMVISIGTPVVPKYKTTHPRQITIRAPAIELDTGRRFNTWRMKIELLYNHNTEKFKDKSKNGDGKPATGFSVCHRDVDLGTADYPLAIKRAQAMLCGDKNVIGLKTLLEREFETYPEAQIMKKRDRVMVDGIDKLSDYSVATDEDEAHDKMQVEKGGKKKIFRHTGDFNKEDMQHFIHDFMQRYEQDLFVVHDLVDVEGGKKAVKFTVLRGNGELPTEEYRPEAFYRDKNGNYTEAVSEYIQVLPDTLDGAKREEFIQHVEANVMQKARCYYASVVLEPNPELKTPQQVMEHFAKIDIQNNRRDKGSNDSETKHFPNLDIDAPERWLKEAITECAREYCPDLAVTSHTARTRNGKNGSVKDKKGGTAHYSEYTGNSGWMNHLDGGENKGDEPDITPGRRF